MAAAFVQSKSDSKSDAGATTEAVTITAVGSGNLVCGMVYWLTATNDLTSVSDGHGNTATIVDTQLNIQGDGNSAASFYFKNVISAATVITANFSSSPTKRGITVEEWSGLDTVAPLDKNVSNSQANPGTGTDAITSTAVVTTANGEVIFGASYEPANSHTANAFSAGTNFLHLDQAFVSGGIATALASESLVQTSAGSIAATFTIGDGVTNTDYATFILTFKAAAGVTVADGMTILRSRMREW